MKRWSQQDPHAMHHVKPGMSKFQFVTLALLFIGTQGAVQFAMQYVVPQKVPLEWEYRTYYLTSRDDGKFYGSDLETIGSEGWELVSTTPGGSQTQICLFKRPIFGPLRDLEEENAESEDEDEG